MTGKKKKLLILGLVLILLLGAAAVLLTTENGGSGNNENETEASAEGQTVNLISLDKGRVESIQITNAEGTYTLSRLEDGTMTVDAVNAYTLNQSLLESAVGIFSSISGEVVYDEAYDVEKFGLDEPAAELSVKAGEMEQVLYLGAYNEGTSSWYVKNEEDNRLYTIASGKGDWLLYSPYAYVDTTLIPAFQSDTDNMLERLTRIRIERPDLEEPLEMVAAEEAATDYTSSYWMTSPVHVKTALKVMNQQIGNLFGFRADAVLGQYTEAESSEYGMDEPAMVMTVEHDGITEVFTVGSQTPEGNRYMITSEKDLLYEISEDKLEFLHATADDLFFEMALLPDINEVVQVVLEFGSERYVFELNHGGNGTGAVNTADAEEEHSDSTDAAADAELTVMLEGQELSEKLFRKFYSFLLEIDIEQINTDEPTGESVMCITYQYADGTEESMEAFAMEEARRMSISVNGEPSFEGRIAYVEKVKTELGHLLAGESIDTNW